MFRRSSPGLMECGLRGCSTTALHFIIVNSEFQVKYQYAYRRHHHHHHNLFYLLHLLHLLRRRRSSTLSLCLQYELPPHHSSSDRTRQSARSTGHLRAGDNQHRARSLSSTRQSKCTRKRDRTVKSVTSSVAERYSRRPFTVFTPKRSTRATRSRATRCKHYCHALLHSGRKCLSPCARRQPGHFHCRCARHQRQ